MREKKAEETVSMEIVFTWLGEGLGVKFSRTFKNGNVLLVITNQGGWRRGYAEQAKTKKKKVLRRVLKQTRGSY